jgi:hypothetical protein
VRRERQFEGGRNIPLALTKKSAAHNISWCERFAGRLPIILPVPF